MVRLRVRCHLCLAQFVQCVHLLLREREIALPVVPAKHATACKTISGQHTTARI